MIAKLFEIRDKHTFIPVVAIRCEPTNEAEQYLLARAGYSRDTDSQASYVLVGKIDGSEIGALNYDPFAWGSETMNTAHLHIRANVDKLFSKMSGQVIDCEFLRGETKSPKQPERLGEPA